MTATAASFLRSGGSNAGETSGIQVGAGTDNFKASGCTFNWDLLSLAAGSVLSTGDVTTNTFNTELLIPIVDVPLLTNNVLFNDVDILPGSSLASGTINLPVLGTGGRTRYVFPGSFTVLSGATLSIGANVNVLIRDEQVVTINSGGTLNIGNGAAVSIEDFSNGNIFEGIVVNGSMTATAASFLRSANDNFGETSGIQVGAGTDNFKASGCTFNWDLLSLAAGSVLSTGDVTTNTFNTELLIPIVDVPLLTNNVLFNDVDILPGSSLASGTINLPVLGTGGAPRYVFPGSFTVLSGATLNIVPPTPASSSATNRSSRSTAAAPSTSAAAPPSPSRTSATATSSKASSSTAR